MSHVQCPVCYSPLEVRDVTPCTICGGWDGKIVESVGAKMEFHEWRLPSGERLTLCPGCELEEFMVPGGWGYRLGLQGKLPISALTPVPRDSPYSMTKDKFCPQCVIRLAFLEIVAGR